MTKHAWFIALGLALCHVHASNGAPQFGPFAGMNSLYTMSDQFAGGFGGIGGGMLDNQGGMGSVRAHTQAVREKAEAAGKEPDPKEMKKAIDKDNKHELAMLDTSLSGSMKMMFAQRFAMGGQTNAATNPMATQAASTAPAVNPHIVNPMNVGSSATSTPNNPTANMNLPGNTNMMMPGTGAYGGMGMGGMGMGGMYNNFY